MSRYAEHVSRKARNVATPQDEPATPEQVRNSAGGYAFAVDDWVRLDRFLVLGNEGGTYYAGERKLTKDNAACVGRCLDADGARTVARIVEVSEAGRAPKNDPAVFALALAASYDAGKSAVHSAGGAENAAAKAVRQCALDALPRVCRTGTHLFQFVQACGQLRGWGRALKRAVAAWYEGKELRQLAYQMVKYQQRDGFSHRDVLRLCHHKSTRRRDVAGETKAGKPTFSYYLDDTASPLDHLLYWGTHGLPAGFRVAADWAPDEPLTPVFAFEAAKRVADEAEVVRLVRDYGLVRECVPTRWLKSAAVWEALLEKMPLTALVRNLATMTRVGLLTPLADATGEVLARLCDGGGLRKSRVHPVQLLAALLTYKGGHSARGDGTWQPVQRVVDALDAAFYLSFGNVETTGKSFLLGLDVSGSMQSGVIAGVPGLTPALGAAALALVTAAAEPRHHFMAFGTVPREVRISPRQRLDDALRSAGRWDGGGTDCSLPMLYALSLGLKVDTFVCLTDNETWAGRMHPFQALRAYRERTGTPAKLVVVGMTATEFSIADPADAGTLDVVGFDLSTPQLIAQFAAATRPAAA